MYIYLCVCMCIIRNILGWIVWLKQGGLVSGTFDANFTITS